MYILYCSSQLVFEGSADSQIFVLDTEKSMNFIISFTGFLPSTTSGLKDFRVEEISIYDGNSVSRIRDTALARIEKGVVTENHSFRKFDLTDENKALIVDWMFNANDIEYFD